jgi:RNA polymerase sigma factor (sigma-70 family)
MEHPPNGRERSSDGVAPCSDGLGSRQPQGSEANEHQAPRAVEDVRSASGLTTSLRLFLSARQGDSTALNRLFGHLLPGLQRWARGRLPSWARRRMDTVDLVQEALVNFFRHLGRIEPKRRRAVRAYLQESIRNRIRDEIRRAGQVETSEGLTPSLPDPGTSPLARAIALENTARYREALRRLDPGDHELIVARVEMGFSYEQLALATGRPSSDAARVAVRRALLRLAEELQGA